jgi:hypothetical protein
MSTYRSTRINDILPSASVCRAPEVGKSHVHAINKVTFTKPLIIAATPLMNKEVDCDANGVPDTPYSGLLKEMVKLLIYH